MKKMKLKIKKIVVDEELYPRVMEDDDLIEEYADALGMGTNFPPIDVALLKGKHILIDGFHRLKAFEKKNRQIIAANVYTDLTRRDIFAMAVKANIKHGKNLSQGEKEDAMVKLKDMKFTKIEISKLMRIPERKFKAVTFTKKEISYPTSYSTIKKINRMAERAKGCGECKRYNCEIIVNIRKYDKKIGDVQAEMFKRIKNLKGEKLKALQRKWSCQKIPKKV